MKINSLIYVITLVLIFASSSITAQDNGEMCGADEYSAVTTDIPTKTPGKDEFLRALFIYVVFPDDNFAGYGDQTIWKMPTVPFPNPIPINPYTINGNLVANEKISDGNFMDRYEEYTISDFFCEMSMGQFDFIGDEVYVTLPAPSTYYIGHGDHWASMNSHVLDYLNNTQSIDWTRYNNWSIINDEWVFDPSDGNAEMVVITYRTIPRNLSGTNAGWFWNPGSGGENTLNLPSPVPFVNGGITTIVNNGVTCLNRGMALGRSELIMEHEITHHLFGIFTHWYEDLIHSTLGMMTPTHANSTFFMSPIERSLPNVEYIPVPSLITSTGTHTLGDFIETGDVLRVQLPGASGKYFWITNNQKKSKYDGLSRGGKTCYTTNYAEIEPYCSEGKGIFVYAENVTCSNFNQIVDIVSAEGKFNWAYDRTVYVPTQNYEFPFGTNVDIWKTIGGNRISGRDEYKKSTGPGTQFLTDNVCSQEGGYNISWDDRGDGLDGFNMGYEEIFSPYSNPSTRTCANSTNYGLTFRLVSQNPTTGVCTLKVYIGQDLLALSECPPSKPKSLKCEKETVGGGFHPKITWDGNIEPDFTQHGGHYKIFRGANYDCSTEPSYIYLATVSHNVTEYTDEAVTLYDKIEGEGNCWDDLVTYSYKISAVDINSDESLKSERALVSGYMAPCLIGDPESRPGQPGDDMTPKEFKIGNYPNPFNPITNIKYSLPKEGFVTIKVYDVVGRMIKELVNEFKEVGNYSVSFDGSDFASGIYFYRIETLNFVDTKRMILVK